MLKKDDPSVYIILLNWNNSDETLECLESLRRLMYPNYRVIIVDNGSKDNSLVELNAFKDNSIFPITILENSNNLGFAGGNNTGINYALEDGADYVLILNNDTQVDQHFLSKLMKEMLIHKDAGIVSPAIYFSEKPRLLWFGGESKICWRKMDKLITSDFYMKPMPQYVPTIKTNFVTGACMLIRSDILEKVIGFDDRFFLYFEDADLSFRIQKEGYELYWVPEAKIWHKVSATTLPQVGSYKMNYYNTRNVLLLARKNGPLWIKVFYMHFWAFYKYSKQVLKFIIPGFDKKLAKAIRKGVMDYYRGKFGKY